MGRGGQTNMGTRGSGNSGCQFQGDAGLGFSGIREEFSGKSIFGIILYAKENNHSGLMRVRIVQSPPHATP